MLTPHITEAQLKNYISSSMPPEEQAVFFRHISECTFCAGKLASAMQKIETVYTPPGLKESILEQTVYNKGGITRNVKFLSFNSRKKRNEFLLYTAKVCFAVSIAVSVIMTTSLPGSGEAGYKNRFSLTKEITEKDRKNNSRVLDLFRSTSGKISEDVSKALNLE